MILHIMEIGINEKDVQSKTEYFNGTLEDYKYQQVKEIEQSPDLEFISTQNIYGGNGIHLVYFAKRMNKEITAYILPIEDIPTAHMELVQSQTPQSPLPS